MKSNQLPLTVIIPTYNEEKNIKKTIFSIKNQKTNLKYEIIVSDGGSSDKTVEIADEFAKIVKSPKKGKVTQMNYGAKQSNGRLLVFLDADTIIPKNYFETIYRKFIKDKNLAACSVPHIYKSKEIISAGTLVLSLLDIIISPLIFGIMTFCQLMFYFFLWDKKFFPVTKYYGISQILFIYFITRAFWKFTEFSGSNICIRREIFTRVGGFKPVPDSKGVDAIFSSALRKFCSQDKSHISMVNSLAVFTDPRFITKNRILKRIRQHRRIAKYYEKLAQTKKIEVNIDG